MKQHATGFLTLVSMAKKRIKELSPQALKQKMDNKETLYIIDVREEGEWASSVHLPQAIHLSKGLIERDIEKIIPDRTASLVVYCSGGFRCALVADNLQQMGYQNVYSLESGLQGWIDAGFEVK